MDIRLICVLFFTFGTCYSWNDYSWTFSEACSGLRFVSRDDCSMQPPLAGNGLPYTALYPTNKVMLHDTHKIMSRCDEGDCCDQMNNLRFYAESILDKKDIEFHFVISKYGVIYEGRGWYHSSTHAPHAADTYGIAFLTEADDDPNDAAAIYSDTLFNLMQCGLQTGFITCAPDGLHITEHERNSPMYPQVITIVNPCSEQ